MHCFIGLHVQEPLAGTILDINHSWDKLGFPPADFHKHTYPHITIIPPFDSTNVDQLIQGLNQVTNSFDQFDADYARINIFNHRIVHIEVESNGLLDLRAKLYDFGKSNFHYQPDHPVYHAHTTVAYTRQPLTRTGFNELKQQLENRLLLPVHQEVVAIQLYGREFPEQDYRTLADLRLKQE